MGAQFDLIETKAIIIIQFADRNTKVFKERGITNRKNESGGINKTQPGLCEGIKRFDASYQAEQAIDAVNAKRGCWSSLMLTAGRHPKRIISK